MSNQDFVFISGKTFVVGAEQHPHAARRLRAAWPELDWAELPTGVEPPKTAAVVHLIEDASMKEGAHRIRLHREGGAPVVTVTGGPFSGVIYGVETITQRRSRPRAGGIEVIPGEFDASPDLTYRSFWTWDHSSNWELSQVGHQEIGVFNPYGKPPSGFLADYRRMVDFCSANQIAGIIVYGFLRDSHGGIEAAQELCRYANERGVRIMPGIAIGSYGGVYWEGNHEYNLATWLRANPQFASDMEKDVGFQIQDLAFPLSFPRSDYTLSACPSAPETMDWMQDAVSWLAETFEIGGINIESGDYGVCGCARCERRRGDRESAARRAGEAESWSHADLADNFPRLHNAVRRARPDAWVYCELQWDNLFDPEARIPLSSLPSDAVYQHTLNRTYWNRVERELTAADVRELPTATNVLRSHFGSQWNGDERTDRYAFSAAVFVDMARKAQSVGMDGLTVWGEASPYNVPNELNYVAVGRFGFDATLEWEQFAAQEIAPRLGGADAASAFVAALEELDANPRLETGRLLELHGGAVDGLTSASGDVAVRWSWLVDRVARRIAMGG